MTDVNTTDQVSESDVRIDVAEQLVYLIYGSARILVEATSATQDLPRIPDHHLRVLEKLRATGPLTPAELAVEMRLARPTISNLVNKLTAAGVVDRVRSLSDGRSVSLVITPKARAILDAYHRGRRATIADALARMSPDEVSEIERGLSAHQELYATLVRMDADVRHRA